MATEPTRRLDGWKAIADYLGRDVRTAQRWRDERGMPVHRVPGGRSATVFADRAELDAWLFQSNAAPLIEPTLSNAETVSPSASVLHRRPHPLVIIAAIGARFRERWITALGVALVGISTVIFGGMRIVRTVPTPPAHVEITGTTLTAHASDNSKLWSHSLGSAAGQPFLYGFAHVDWDGRPNSDIVAFVNRLGRPTRTGATPFVSYEIYCFSSEGRVRWTYDPAQKLSFGGRHFSGPWRPIAWLVSGAKPRVWTSFVDNTWWPSFVVRLGPDGVSDRVFVNAGHIYVLARVESANGVQVLAGGVNNEYRAAALAVLNEDGGLTSSPQTDDSSFACDDCPSERPRRYFVLPRSELSAAFGEPYNYVDAISVPLRPDGLIDVSVRESPEPWNLRSVYRFSTELMPESVGLSDRYWEVHRELSKTGKLDHAVEDCPERSEGMLVRVWQPDAGWKNIRVAPTFVTHQPAK
jgi:hypothetical protein